MKILSWTMTCVWELTKLTMAWGAILICVAVPSLGVAVIVGTLLYTISRD